MKRYILPLAVLSVGAVGFVLVRQASPMVATAQQERQELQALLETQPRRVAYVQRQVYMAEQAIVRDPSWRARWHLADRVFELRRQQRILANQGGYASTPIEYEVPTSRERALLADLVANAQTKERQEEVAILRSSYPEWAWSQPAPDAP